eukprot:scaffold1097_cov246-Pinguiococcus_pyrenoidosus.AAC.9
MYKTAARLPRVAARAPSARGPTDSRAHRRTRRSCRRCPSSDPALSQTLATKRTSSGRRCILDLLAKAGCFASASASPAAGVLLCTASRTRLPRLHPRPPQPPRPLPWARGLSWQGRAGRCAVPAPSSAALRAAADVVADAPRGPGASHRRPGARRQLRVCHLCSKAWERMSPHPP